MAGVSSNATTGKRHLAADHASTNGATKNLKRRKLGKSAPLADEGKKIEEKKAAESEVTPQGPKGKESEKKKKAKKEKKEKKEKTATPSKDTQLQQKNDASNEVDITPKDIDHVQEQEQHWVVSETVGGRFDDNDPVFSDDEKHLFLSAGDAVHVLSTSTSSLVRVLCPSANVKVSGYALSRANREHIYVATITGKVFALNWTTGEQVSAFEASNGGGSIHGVHSAAFEAQKTDKKTIIEDIVFVMGEKIDDSEQHDAEKLDEKKGKGKEKKKLSQKHFISAHMATSAGRWKSRVIFNTHLALNSHLLRPSLDGKIVIAAAGNMLIAGNTSQISLDAMDGLSFEWLEMALPLSHVTSLDIRSPAVAGEKNETPRKALRSKKIDLVIGEKKGSILIYNDILNTLTRKATQNEGEKSNEIISTRLHWHRYAVKSVRWSRDGNYLISGGSESVLVLWQLDTGRKQFLPHLVSSISAISVSPFGDAYAVKLANNSVMVLSTSELQPTANISGLQIVAPTKKHSKNTPSSLKSHVSALLHPIHPGQILTTVPSTPSPSAHSESTLPPSSFSFLQTYDLRANRHVARQPLTRTHVTVLSNGPEGTPLTTPDVTHLAITPDARWLASVDLWRQYTPDSRVLNPAAENAGPAEEIFFKIWRWDERSSQWELNTRVEKPHVINGGLKEEAGAAQVLDLIAKSRDPRDLEEEEDNDDQDENTARVFVTLGTDAAVRMWSPSTRAKGSRTEAMPATDSWRCYRSIHLEKSGSTSTHPPSRDGRICYSADSSVLGICWISSRGKNHTHGVVHLVDADSGKICHSRSAGIFAHDTPASVKGIGFVDKYFVVLSQGQLAVWDTVADSVRTLDQPSGASFDNAISMSVNQTSNTFAVLFTSGLVAIYAPTSASPISTVDVLGNNKAQIVSLLADPSTGDFLVADSLARVQRLSSGKVHVHLADNALESRIAATTKAIVPQADVRDKLHKVLQVNEKNKNGTPEDSTVPDINEGPAGTNSKSLANVFDTGPSFAMPGVQTLFDNVIQHFGEK